MEGSMFRYQTIIIVFSATLLSSAARAPAGVWHDWIVQNLPVNAGAQVDTNGDRRVDNVNFDRNGDTIVDASLFDFDQNGIFEWAYIDTNFNGKFDVRIRTWKNETGYSMRLLDANED